MFYLRDLFDHTMWANQTANGRSGRSHSPPPDIPTLTQNLQDECLQWRLQIFWHHLLDLQALHSLPMQHFNVYASCHMLSVAVIPILKIHLIYDPLFKDILFCIKYYCLLRVYFRCFGHWQGTSSLPCTAMAHTPQVSGGGYSGGDLTDSLAEGNSHEGHCMARWRATNMRLCYCIWKDPVWHNRTPGTSLL